MLTDGEKRGIGDLLDRMESRDLISLAQTVTSRLILPDSSSDAIQAIILHTDKAVDLLKRRKLKKELLFKYLHEKKVPIDGQSDKSEIVRKVLEVWGCHDEVDIFMDDENSVDGPPPAPVPSRNASHTSLCSLDFMPSAFTVKDTHSLRRAGSSLSVMNTDDTSNSSFTFGTSAAASVSVTETFSSLPSMSSGGLGGQVSAFTQSQCQEMANDFVKWYFDLINTCIQGDGSVSDFGPAMFFPDASAKVNLLGVNGECLENFQVEENADEVCSMLKDVVRRHGLQFNPNLCDEGVRGRLDPHGLVVVLSCGTIHNQHTVCGVFEQAFGLVRDPGSENNWKIKQTEARLFAKSVIEKPSLANSSLCAIAYS